jgi:hypothetical protein
VQGIGTGDEGAGVRGIASDPDGNGVVGQADNGPDAYGVLGISASGYAGYFSGTVVVDGDFYVTPPHAKHAVVPFPDGTHRALYCLESPESWFEDFGYGQLAHGEAQIALDPDFVASVSSDAYHVFVTEYEDNTSLYVTNRTSTGFEVRAKTSTAASTFSYRVVAKRRDVAHPRFERVTLPSKALRMVKSNNRSLPVAGEPPAPTGIRHYQ